MKAGSADFTYEPERQLLFVSAVAAEWQGEWRPVIHAFQVRC